MDEAGMRLKKRIDRHYLDRLLSHINISLDGEIQESEEPDFLIRSHACSIGIEVTELHRNHQGNGRPLQADEAMRQRVVDRAQALFEAAAYPHLQVAVHFNEHHPIQKTQVEGVARAIVELAAGNIPEVGGSYAESYTWTNRAYFPEALHKISVRRLARTYRSFFRAPSATWVTDIQIEDVNRVLESKESKCASYRTRCDQAWLLINTDISTPSTWFDRASVIKESSFTSSFDRVFVLRHSHNQLIELTLQSKESDRSV